jgi:hypothetical protein
VIGFLTSATSIHLLFTGRISIIHVVVGKDVQPFRPNLSHLYLFRLGSTGNAAANPVQFGKSEGRVS